MVNVHFNNQFKLFEIEFDVKPFKFSWYSYIDRHIDLLAIALVWELCNFARNSSLNIAQLCYS